MRKFCVTLLLLIAATSAAGGETKKDITLSEMFIRPGLFGLPRYAADPFTCNTETKSAVYYNTASNTSFICNGTLWGAMGGSMSSPIAGDYVATGLWTWGTALGAVDAIGIGNTGADSGCISFEGATLDAHESFLCVDGPTVGDQKYLLPNAGAAVTTNLAALGVANTFTLMNIFTNPVVFGTADGAAHAITMQQTEAGSIKFEGGTADAVHTYLVATDPTAGDQVYALPNAAGVISDTLVALGVAQSMTNKGISSGTAASEGQYGLNTASVPDLTTLSTGTLSNAIHIAEFGDVGYNFTNGPCGGVGCTDPTLVIHSHNQATAEWLALSHNGTDGQIDVGTGAIELLDSFQLKSSGAGTPVTFKVPKITGTGAGNTIIGSGAGASLTSTASNVIIGDSAITGGISVNQATVVGTSAQCGTNNGVCIGYKAGTGMTGQGNVCIGGTGTNATCAGVNDYNVIIGYNAMYADTSNTMDHQICIGYQCGNELIDDSDYNICVGDRACQSTSAATHVRDYALAIGHEAAVSADHQAVFGGDAGYYDNFFFGSGSLDATPTSATLNATGGYGTDITAASLSLAGGIGTGTGLGGDVIVKVSPQSTTAATQNALVTQTQVVAKRYSITDNTATSVLNVTAPAGDSCMLTLEYTAKTKDAADIQSRAGIVHLLINEDPDAASYACSATEQATVTASLVTGGTFTSAWSCVAAATTNLQVTLDSSLNTAATLQYTVTNNSGCVLAVP